MTPGGRPRRPHPSHRPGSASNPRPPAASEQTTPSACPRGRVPTPAGAAAGNAFTISNVLAAKAVMGLQATPEALFLARTLPLGLLMCLVAQAFGLIFTLGGALGEVPPLG
jgi:hypothetical protein